jgi:hypothetical protein
MVLFILIEEISRGHWRHFLLAFPAKSIGRLAREHTNF